MIAKMPGDTFGVKLLFNHIGVAEKVWVGIGLAYAGVPKNPPFVYAMIEATYGPDYILKDYWVIVDSVLPLDTLLGKLIDVQRFMSRTKPVVGFQPPNDFRLNNWDDEIYGTYASKFDNLRVDPAVGYY